MLLQELVAGGVAEVLLSAVDPAGHTLLHMFAALRPADREVVFNRSEVAWMLLEARAHVSSRNSSGRTPLLLAARAAVDSFEDGSLDCEVRLATVRTLLEMRADPNVGDVMEETPLMEAACVGDVELCRVLLASSADANLVSRAGLAAADFTDNHPKVRELLMISSGLAKSESLPLPVSPAPTPPVADADAGRGGAAAVTPLAKAAHADNSRITLALDDLQAALSHCGEAFEEAAGRRVDAALSRLRSVVEADLKSVDPVVAEATEAKAYGAAMQARNADGGLLLQLCRALSPASLAADAALWLVAAGAEPNVRDALGETALALAVRAATAKQCVGSPGIAVARALLQAKADPNIGDGEGATPLRDACIYGHPELAQVLLSAGSDSLVAKEYMIS